MPTIKDDDVVLVRGHTKVDGTRFAAPASSVHAAIAVLKKDGGAAHQPFLSALINSIASGPVSDMVTVDARRPLTDEEAVRHDMNEAARAQADENARRKAAEEHHGETDPPKAA